MRAAVGAVRRHRRLTRPLQRGLSNSRPGKAQSRNPKPRANRRSVGRVAAVGAAVEGAGVAQAVKDGIRVIPHRIPNRPASEAGVMPNVRFAAILIGWALVCPSDAYSQPRRPGGAPNQGVAPMVMVYTFAPDDGATLSRFDLDQAIPGLVYSGPGFLISIARGTSADHMDGVASDLEFTDFSLRLRSDLVSRRLSKGVTISVPVLLLSTYRRVQSEQDRVSREIFEHTAAGVGSGVALTYAGRAFRVETRATPAIGFTTRSFGNSFGRFLAAEVDIQATVPRIYRRLGLSVGYGWGWQQWHVSGFDALVSAGSGKVDFSGTAHTVRFGVAW